VERKLPNKRSLDRLFPLADDKHRQKQCIGLSKERMALEYNGKVCLATNDFYPRDLVVTS